MISKKPNIHRLVVILLALLVLQGCSGLGSKATPTPLPEVNEVISPLVSATGVVLPERFNSLSLGAGGLVLEVLVGENQAVRAGDPLLRLEGSEQYEAALAAARLEVARAQYDLDQLYKDPEMRAAAAGAALVQARKDLRDAERRWNNLQTASSDNDIEQARANVAIARDKMERAREDYEPYARKPEDNPVRAAFLSKKAQAEKDYENAVRKLNNLLAGANVLDQDEGAAELALAEAALVVAQRKYELALAGPDPEDVRLAEERLSNGKAQLAAAEAMLAQLELAAPYDGVVSEVYVKPDEWVAPGQPLILVADLAALRVETTDLNEIDVARLVEGDSAIITFDALPEVSIGGRVRQIASKASAGTGVNYTVVLDLAEIPDGLRWGMTAFVDIELDR